MAGLGREAFVYMEPRPGIDNEEDFAQCISCRFYCPKVGGAGRGGQRCVAHGSYFGVKNIGTCGVYTPWQDGRPVPEEVANHTEILAQGIQGAFTPEESGYLPHRVQCHRCEYGGRVCGLYVMLNRTLPKVWKLEESIKRHSCCNGWASPLSDKDGDEDWYSKREAQVRAKNY